MEDELLKKIKKSQKIFIMVAAILVFCATLYYVFFLSKNSASDAGTDVSARPAAVEDSYQEYKNYISDTNKGIKNLLEGEQLKEITLYDYPSTNKDFETNDNPFLKSF